MARLKREERLAIGRRRIVNILRAHTVANLRTLEQKISDAGPNPQRVDPHFLTTALHQLQRDGRVVAIQDPVGKWFHLHDALPPEIDARLAVLRPLIRELYKRDVLHRTGQALEIACFRAARETKEFALLGGFLDLDKHDDSTLYKKDGPPMMLNERSIAPLKLDFMLLGQERLGVEVKNIREWFYPDRDEVRELLRKALALDVVPVLIARRLHYTMLRVLSPAGVLLHETFNQRFAEADSLLAAQLRDKALLGYHDIRTGNEPDARLRRFFLEHLPNIAAPARERFEGHKDLLEPFAAGEMSYQAFAGRLIRRERRENEDGDWPGSDDFNPV